MPIENKFCEQVTDFLSVQVQPEGYNRPMSIYELLEDIKYDMELIAPITAKERFTFSDGVDGATRQQLHLQVSALRQILSEGIRYTAHTCKDVNMRTILGEPPREQGGFIEVLESLFHYNATIIKPDEAGITKPLGESMHYAHSGKPAASMLDRIHNAINIIEKQYVRAFEKYVDPAAIEEKKNRPQLTLR